MKATNRYLNKGLFLLVALAGFLTLSACRSTPDKLAAGATILVETAAPAQTPLAVPGHVPTAGARQALPTTPTRGPSATPSPILSATPSRTPPATPTHTPSVTPSRTPSATPSRMPALPPDRMPLPNSTGTEIAGRDEGTPVYGYRVVNTYPHDRGAFTQGLVYHNGALYEGTGLRGQSTLRRVELETGIVLQLLPLPEAYFGEGIALFGDRIYQLTWQSNTGFIYDQESFDLLGMFFYPTEGWGLTHDGERLIMSDGTATVHFLDPETLEETGQIEVYDGQGPVTRLNELEYVQGEVYANVWQTDWIARIDPQSGRVVGWIDLHGLLSPEDYDQPVDVLNGIAYDAKDDRLFVTGKLWPKLFEIELVPLE